MKKLVFLITAFLIAGSVEIFAQISLEIKPVIQGSSITVNADSIPMLKAKIRASADGMYLNLKPENVIIQENNRTVKPAEIIQGEDNWNEIKWYTPAPGPLMPNYVTFYVSHDNNFSGITGYYTRQDMPQIGFKNIDYEAIDYLSFGKTAPGDKKYQRFILNAAMAKKDTIDGEYTEVPLHIDSIRTHSKEFSWYWHGSIFNDKKPPLDINSGFAYKVSGIFEPPDTNYYRDRLTVYYDGGAQKDLDLIGNFYHLETESVLQLEYPLGGEVLTPCDEIDFRWTGHAGEFPTLIEYTSNEGVTWKIIGSSQSSSYKWKIPKDLTGDLLFRIRQKDTLPTVYNLKIDDTPVYRISFRKDGEKMLAANVSGYIYEYDIETKVPTGPYKIGSYKYPADVIIITGLDYIEQHDMFAVSYYKNIFNQNIRNDSIAFFKTGQFDKPLFKIAAGNRYYIGNMYVEPERRYIVIQPSFGSRLRILDPETGDFIRTVDFENIITSVSFSRNTGKMVASLLNGKVQILSLPDFQVEKTLDFSYLPIITQLALAPNGKYLAIGEMPPQGTMVSSSSTKIHIFDIDKNMIVRSNGRISSAPLGLEFNAESSILVVGSRAVPQIMKWYLESDYVETSGGNAGELTDFAFSPDGHSLATSSASDDNLNLRTVVFEEIDQTEDFVHVISPSPSLDSLNAGEIFIGENRDYTIDTLFCNAGEVPLYVFNAYMKKGIFFKITGMTLPDTLLPGECFPVQISFNPLDTGLIEDELVIVSCSKNYEIKLKGISKKRNISFYSEVFDFGEQCLLDTTEKEVLFIKNEDPVPLTINSISFFGGSYNSFETANVIQDTVLPPGESMSVDFRFIPRELGENKTNAGVKHSFQQKLMPQAVFRGTGIGTFLGLKSERIMFIPEIRQRTFTIENKASNLITIEDVTFKPEGIYRLITPMPVDIEGLDSTLITIEWYSNEFEQGTMTIKASPCATASDVVLDMYSGNSQLSIPTVEADPRGSAVIPVFFKNTENRSYKGVRFFDAEIEINPRMFYPEEVISLYGEAVLTKNEIIDDRRVIGFRVDGVYPIEGTVAEIHGIAGLAETDSSPIEFREASPFWGTAVSSSHTPGTLKLFNLCGERRVLHPQNNIEIVSLKPNPVNDFCEIQFELSRPGYVTLEIYDNLGNKVQSTSEFYAREGVNIINIPAYDLLPGTYRVLIKMGGDFAAKLFIVVR